MAIERQDGYPYLTKEALDEELGRYVDGNGGDYVLYTLSEDGQVFVAECEAGIHGRLAEAFGLEVCDIGGSGEDDEAYGEQMDKCDVNPYDIYPEVRDGAYDWETTGIRFAVVNPQTLTVEVFTTTEEVATTSISFDGSLRAVRISDIVA